MVAGPAFSCSAIDAFCGFWVEFSDRFAVPDAHREIWEKPSCYLGTAMLEFLRLAINNSFGWMSRGCFAVLVREAAGGAFQEFCDNGDLADFGRNPTRESIQ